jgi:hypothetical protein
MAWIFAWHYEIVPLSLIIMLVLLGCLAMIYLRLDIGRSRATAAEKYLVHLPFSVYLGWITIASIANITVLLVDSGWNGLGVSGQFWAVGGIMAGMAIAIAMLFRKGDVFYCLVIVWALLGILVKRLGDVTRIETVIGASFAGIVLLSVGIVTQLARRRAYVLRS